MNASPAASPAAGPAPILRIENLSIGYRRNGRVAPALVDVNLELHAAEAVAIVGESGCGKSTLGAAILNVLAKNALITSGSVCIDGIDITRADDRTLRGLRGRVIAMVSQEPGRALNPSMTIGAQVVEAVRAMRRSGEREAQASALELLTRVAIRDAAIVSRRYPHQVSGGQKQRVLIAMALAGNPRVLVLDEPTTGLDATVEADVIQLIATLRKENSMAIVFISHNLALVRRVCERIAVLYAGRIVESGTSSDVFDRPAYPYTADLLDCIPRLDHDKTLRPLAPIPGEIPDPFFLPVGCVFSPRCSRRSEACDLQRPALTVIAEGHLTRCLFPERVANRRQIEGKPPIIAPIIDQMPSPDEPLLQIRGVCKSFGGVRVCENISFDIHRGETLGLVGESGSGKTTLAHCIVGIVSPDAGTVALNGSLLPASIRQRSMSMIRDLQMVFQSPDSTLNPRFTARMTLARSLARLRGNRRLAAHDVERLASAVQFPGGLLDRRPARLSGGQKQRVSIGRALAGSAALVLCDEPVSALDVSVQAGILNVFASLQRESRVSYLFISHDLAVVRYLSDRIGVMYLGQLVEIGITSDVLDGPRHPYTTALINAAASGFSPARAADAIAARSMSKGCRFAARCSHARPLCLETAPPLRSSGRSHSILCHLSLEELS